MPEDLVRSNDHKDTPEEKGMKMEVWDGGAGGHERKFRALVQRKNLKIRGSRVR